MITPQSPLERLVDWLGSSVKRLLKRARKRWATKSAPKRRKRRKSAASRAAKMLAKKRWAAKRAKPAVNNVVPFKRHRRVG
jgi:hypothetical protein